MATKTTKKTFRICYFREKAKRKELEKENVLLKENNRSLEELMKRPELELVRENIQLRRNNDLLLINECSVRQENKKLKEVLNIIINKDVCPRQLLKYSCSNEYNAHQLYEEEFLTKDEFNLLKEYFKDE